MDSNLSREMPAQLSAERAILGSILVENDCINFCAEHLRAKDFYDSRNQEIYKAMQALSAQMKPIDLQTLEEQLSKQGTLEGVGGTESLIEISMSEFYYTNIEHYVKIVKDKSILRSLIKASQEIMAMSYQEEGEVARILERAETSIFEIAEHKDSRGLVPVQEVLRHTVKRIEDISKSGDTITGVPTGFRGLDEILSGLQASDLILLAARPSMGKTALGVNMALNAASKGYKVAIFSLEMSRMQLSQRLLAMTSGVNLGHIIGGQIEDWDSLFEGVQTLASLPIYIDDTPSISVTEFRAKCRRMKAEHGLDLIVVDYLQLMTIDTGRRSDNFQQEVSMISRNLKAVAKEMNVPLLALSQLSRAVESRTNKEPILSDLRDSGAIEQDADVVMMLYREDYYDENSERKNITDVLIRKHRNGALGRVELFFIKELTKFGDIEYEQDKR